MALAQETCVACRSDSPKVTRDEQRELGREISDWDVVEVDGEQRLRRVFAFQDFKSALAFTQQVGDAAEAAGHHPAILTEWGKVTVSWWTHTIRGLHRNDYVMAAKTDELYKKAAGKKSG